MIRIWVCRVLQLGYLEGDKTLGARVGLPAYCKKEQHEDCGWSVAFDPAEAH